MDVSSLGVGWSVRGKAIVQGIDALFPDGTVTGLIGPNGSGKTTLLSLLAGVRRPAAGRVRAGSFDVHRLGGRERARLIALVEQDVSTSLELTVRDVVSLGRIPHRGLLGPDVLEVMKRTEVDHLADRLWGTLSGGERQRTQLARALAQDPEILLLDEPTNHLDLGHQLDFMATVRSLGITTIAALHDLNLAAAFCDRLVVLQAGRVVASGAVDDVLTEALLADVYGVLATVTPHPSTGRPLVVWHGTC
jgi:iron complex transport system ATP-binding protein